MLVILSICSLNSPYQISPLSQLVGRHEAIRSSHVSDLVGSKQKRILDSIDAVAVFHIVVKEAGKKSVSGTDSINYFIGLYGLVVDS